MTADNIASKVYQQRLEEVAERVCKANDELILENEKLKAAIINKDELLKQYQVAYSQKWKCVQNDKTLRQSATAKEKNSKYSDKFDEYS